MVVGYDEDGVSIVLTPSEAVEFAAWLYKTRNNKVPKTVFDMKYELRFALGNDENFWNSTDAMRAHD